MPDLKQALKDFVATSNSGKYSDEKVLMSKFPELKGYDVNALKDYVATSNSKKYKTDEELNSKFPEFFPVKKKKNRNLPIKKIYWNWLQNQRKKILCWVQNLKRKFRGRVL